MGISLYYKKQVRGIAQFLGTFVAGLFGGFQIRAGGAAWLSAARAIKSGSGRKREGRGGEG